MTFQVYFDDLRHFQTHRNTGHCRCHVHTTHADAQHADGTTVRCVAVTTHAQLARNTKSRYMYRMADSVARSGNMHTITLCHRLQINVVIRRLVIQI